MLQQNKPLFFLFMILAPAIRVSAQHPHSRPEPATTTTAPAPAAPAPAPGSSKPGEPGPVDQISVTEHEMTVDGQPLKYQARAGQLVLHDETGKAKAEMFFVAYEKESAAENAVDRPLTFIFNGGPGAAAVWLHLGAAGPMRVKLDENGDPPAPPFALVENPDTWLAATDLVFIDPVGTGYSRPAPGEKAEQFYGVEEDVRSVAEFIRLYTTRYQRWLSPKFLAGESYGTTRAAVLGEHLISEPGIALNGIILISSVLNFETMQAGVANDLPYALNVPSYAAVAWYHKKLAPDLQADLHKTLTDAEHWAMHDYITALAAGNALDEGQRASVAQTLARFTGLSVEYILRSDLRIDSGGFRKELLIDSRQLVGRFDARIAGYDPDPLARDAVYDPSLEPYLTAYSTVFNEYVRRTLKFETDREYEALSGKVGPWNAGPGGLGHLDVSVNLRDAMLATPHLRVLFASGYFDLATPYMTASYTIDHMNLSPSLRKNLSHTFYEGGHMLYHNRSALTRLTADVAAFVRNTEGK